jgi:peroxiredoxin
LRDKLKLLKETDAQLLAIDPHEIWSAKYLLRETGFKTDDLQYPMLMDPTQTVSAMYGVAFQMRIHTELSNRPATFVIDKQGILRYAKPARTFADRPRPEQIITEIRKLKKP